MTTNQLSPEHAAEMAEMYRKLSPRLSAYARRLTGDDQYAADLVMEALAEAAERWDDLRCQGHVAMAMWLITVIKRRWIDEVRKRETVERYHADVRRRSEPPHVGPEEIALARALTEAFDRAIEELPARTREVAHLKWRQGKSDVGIADELGMKKGTVAWHVHKARAALNEALDKLRSDGASDTPQGGAR